MAATTGWAALAGAAPLEVPIYTQYASPPLDAGSSGNLTGALAQWLTQRSAGRYRFVPVGVTRAKLDALVAPAGWRGVVAWMNPLWLGDVDRKRFSWTEALMSDADLVVSHRDAPLEYLDDGRTLIGHSVGAVSGRRLNDLEGLIQTGQVRRLNLAREVDALTALKARQVDAALIQALTLERWRRANPGQDGWLHVAKQPRSTYLRYLFVAPGDVALKRFLDEQLPALQADPTWQARLPQTPRQLRLVMIEPLDGPYGPPLRRILDEAFERVGLRYALSWRPGERALIELSTGSFDGDALRLPGFGSFCPACVRVDPPHSQVRILAVARHGTPAPADWEGLAGARVAVNRGFKAIEARLARASLLQRADSFSACIDMVEWRRVDYCVVPGQSLAAVGIDGKLGPDGPLAAYTLETQPVHLWLRQGLEAEAARLGAAIQAMQRDGQLERLRSRP